MYTYDQAPAPIHREHRLWIVEVAWLYTSSDLTLTNPKVLVGVSDGSPYHVEAVPKWIEFPGAPGKWPVAPPEI